MIKYYKRNKYIIRNFNIKNQLRINCVIKYNKRHINDLYK